MGQTLLSDVVARAVQEAIQTLGYLKTTAQETVERLCILDPSLHPRAVTTAFRKEGEQISRDEKRALGLRANGFMSREALDQLTDKGLRAPLDAHLQTVLRAGFTINRARTLAAGPVQLPRESYVIWQYASVFSNHCRGCKRLDRRKFDPEGVSIFPPSDCDVEGCAMMFRARIRSTLMNYDD